MNLNDFVVLPNNKAKSIKLNARNLQELQMETVSLAQESKEMEEKLQQLKQSMSKEKRERGHSGGFRWKSGQCGSLTSNAITNSTKTNKENRLQKLSAGKMMIRVLKDESLTAPPQPPPPPPTTRKNRLRGTICGQCEVKTAGLICAECTENYCIGCFARFHQKGALKLHRMIAIQTDLQTHVSTRDVVSYSPSTFTSVNSSPNSKPNPSHTSTSGASTRRGDQSPEKGTEVLAKPMQLHPDTCQVLVVNHGEEKKLEIIEEGLNREDEKGFPTSLLRGEYNEEESARSFQEALRQWRGETSDGAGDPIREDAMWIPVRPVSVSAMATQADLPPDREAEGRGCRGGQRGVPVRVEFTENSLTYTDRLLLKKHRRTPIETYDPALGYGPDLKPLHKTNTEEDRSLTAQEEDFRHYCASLFAVPVSRGRTEAQITAPEPCLVIEVLDETDRDINGVFVAEHRTNNNGEVPLFQQVSSNVRTLGPQTSGGSLRVNRSSRSPTQPFRQSRAPAQPMSVILNTASPSKGMPSAPPTAETQRTSKTSIKTSISKSQKSNCSLTDHKSKADHGSPQLSQVEILKFLSPLSFPTDVSPLTRSSTPKENPSLSPSVSFSLRSTFTVSPSSSTESTLLPRVYHSTPLQKGSDSSLLPEQFQSSKLFPEPISSPKLLQSPPSNLETPMQSQDSLCDPECLLSVNQLELPQSSRPNPQTKSLEPSRSQTNPVPFRAPVKNPSSFSLFNKSPPDAYSSYKSTPTYGNAPVFISSTSISCDHELALTHQDTDACMPSLSPHPLDVTQDPLLAVKMVEEEELSVDSGDEMSSDSLGLAPHEEDSSDEEAQMHGCLTRGKSRDEEQGNSAISHLGDSFVPTDAEREKYLRTDEPEQLSEPSMVMHNQSAGFGSEQFCDLDGFSPLGLDLNSGHSDTTEHTHCDPLRTCQTSPSDSDPTGSESRGPSSSLSAHTEKHLVFSVMQDNHMQSTGIQICSTTPTRRGKTSANELGTSGSNWSGTSTPTLSHPPRITPAVFTSLSHSPSPPPLSSRLSRPALGSELGPAFRPLSRATQEIMEICSMDQSGCEDPDLDTDTTVHTLHGLEQELRLMAKGTDAHKTGMQASVFGTGKYESQHQHGNQHLTWDRVSEEQKEEEEAAQRDRQSVLLLS
ncbi:mucin-2 isoform X1 [Seriola aureovittata]|uniref:mucin-2 isoform X1 n=1 Tax=Seriola aureovittata TaxID=2871759 RepID=UPI0024BDC585|nr:mucin-2 isoform X1 [Seriola aureovittata]